MDLYVHEQGTEALEKVSVEPTATVRELAGAGFDVWVEDTDEPMDPAAVIGEVGLVDRAHVHRSRCRRVTGTVRFNGETKEHSFAPGATVNRVFLWAVGQHGYDLPRDQRAKHTLGVTGADTEADRDAHIGSLATNCAVSFDLAPKARYAG